MNYVTAQELYETMLTNAKEDAVWDTRDVVIDYINGPIGSDDKKRELKHCTFDVVATTSFGGSEGIYADVRAVGYIDGGDTLERVHLCTLKTLGTDETSYLAIGNLANLIAYHGMKFVGENLDRFEG